MLNIFEFGKQLIETEDLDPVYVAIHNSSPQTPQLMRMILAYSCFYHLGVAAFLSEKSDSRYWDLITNAAINEGLGWPRGAERRHFRGKQAVQAIAELRMKYKHPEEVVNYWFEQDQPITTFKSLTTRVKEHRGFGPWIAFKMADMAERLGWPVDFRDCELGIYKDPRQGAALFLHGEWEALITNEELKTVISRLVDHFKAYEAPPNGNRRVNVQEVETILCKYKSYYKKHYYVGKDISEIREALKGWGKQAEKLLEAMPENVPCLIS